MDFIEIKTVYIILHLLGVVVGMGGAVMSDMLFMRATKDKIISKEELPMLDTGGKMVWAGLALIYISGALLFMLNPEGYMESSKFISKMAIVGIITLNGVLIHLVHIPVMKKCLGQNLTTSPIFKKRSMLLFVSGAVSATSWLWALVLGVFRGIPYSVETILSVYIGTVLIAVVVALFARIHFFKT